MNDKELIELQKEIDELMTARRVPESKIEDMQAALESAIEHMCACWGALWQAGLAPRIPPVTKEQHDALGVGTAAYHLSAAKSKVHRVIEEME